MSDERADLSDLRLDLIPGLPALPCSCFEVHPDRRPVGLIEGHILFLDQLRPACHTLPFGGSGEESGEELDDWHRPRDWCIVWVSPRPLPDLEPCVECLVILGVEGQKL